jgi:hypothetical protein
MGGGRRGEGTREGRGCYYGGGGGRGGRGGFVGWRKSLEEI